MKPTIFFVFLFGLQLIAGPRYRDSVDSYLKFLKENESAIGPLEGEVEILTDPRLIHQAQENQKKKSLQAGLSEDQAEKSTQLGIVTQDAYWVVVRDPVRFPSGFVATYDRLFHQNHFKAKKTGSIILPVNEEGKIALILTYRHPARSWEVELPKGSAEAGEGYQQAAARELKEETGLIARQLVDLGEVSFAVVGPSRPHVFYAQVQTKQQVNPQRDISEAIRKVIWLTEQECMTAFRKNRIEIEDGKEKISAPFRDPLLGHALLLAKSFGHIR